MISEVDGAFTKHIFLRNKACETLWIEEVDQITDISPFGGVREGLGVNVRAHFGGKLVNESDWITRKGLVQPRDRDSMRARKIAHRRIAARLCDPNHRLVVLMELQLGLVRKKGPP